MNNLHEPQSAETRKVLEEDLGKYTKWLANCALGLKPYEPHGYPSYADPDTVACKFNIILPEFLDLTRADKIVSLGFFGLSVYMRQQAVVLGLPRLPWTINALSKLQNVP